MASEAEGLADHRTGNTSRVIHPERRDDTVIVLFDQPGRSVNTLSLVLIDEFAELLDQVEADPEISSLVIASGKPEGFIAGADLEILRQLEDPSQITAFSTRGNALLSRLANSRLTTVAAIHGAAMGGGLEVALACDYRLATDAPGTRLALPEVKLGLLPAGGGTQRLPRLVGLPSALDMMLSGRNVYPARAKQLGLVDRVVPTDQLLDAALAIAHERPAQSRPSWLQRLVLAIAPLRRLVMDKARAQLRRKTRGVYPAPERIIDVVAAGLDAGMEQGLAAEADAFAELALSRECRALLGLFFAMQAAGNVQPRQARPVQRLAVVGAGLMGAGIADVSLRKGYDVVLRDISEETVARAGRNIGVGLERRVRQGALSIDEAERAHKALQTTTEVESLATSELVIEAVFEDLTLKRSLLAELEGIVGTDTIIASNTSSLPIADIAAGARHPERVIGMHYFSPVPKMPLLEIIGTPANPAHVVDTARAVGQRQGKTVIVVRDGPGFYTTRVLAAMLNEVLELLGQGARIEVVDNVLRDWGFAVGAVTLMDEVGLDVGAHVRSGALGEMFAARGVQGSNILRDMVAAGALGRKSGRGFYRYPGRGRKQVNDAAYELFGGGPRRNFDAREIQDRVGLIFVNEAIRCLQEEVIASPGDGDLGAVLGLGFPPQRGGPFRFVDTTGAEQVLSRLQALQQQFGPRFEPADLLIEHATEHRPFHRDPS